MRSLAAVLSRRLAMGTAGSARGCLLEELQELLVPGAGEALLAPIAHRRAQAMLQPVGQPADRQERKRNDDRQGGPRAGPGEPGRQHETGYRNRGEQAADPGDCGVIRAVRPARPVAYSQVAASSAVMITRFTV